MIMRAESDRPLAAGLSNQVPLKSVNMLVARTWESLQILRHELRLVHQRCHPARTV